MTVAVPYLTRDGVGVSLMPDRVGLVEVVVGFGHVGVRRSGTAPIGADGAGAALGQLAAELGLVGRAVHAHVDPSVLTVETVEVPAFGDAEDVRVWLEGQAARATTGRRAADAWAPPVGDDVDAEGHEHRAIIASAPQADVDGVQAVLAAAGLVPARVGTGVVEAATPVAALGDDAERTVVLVAEADGAGVVDLDGGRVRDVRWVALDPGLVLDETEAVLGPRPDVAVGGGAAAEVLAVAGARARGLAFPGVEPELTVAFGLALEATRPELRGLDFLPADARADAERVDAKRTGQRAVLLVGLVLLLALLAVEAARIGFAGALARAAARNALRADEVTSVEALRRDVERRRRDLTTARRSADERTDVAGVLERVAYAVPEDVWLSALTVDSTGLVASGYALVPGGVTTFLRALEQEPVVASASLRQTVRLDPETSADVSRPVVSFEIRGRLQAP